jgi:predicted metal-dependent hydrolase
LPWNLIDYVLLHELAHTKVLKHDKKFWDTLESFLPGAKNIKKDLNKFHPVIIGTNFSPM